ncbi:ABC transporter substrate-binding protein [Actinacidiphila sp. DG2A-62]|jgi:cellobiose transport system substrate-binding protein|uniref:ABC transporter substrate-binding protein n=1 Tax=Actinacidiphila sp. DG2A-62 TaxID=3108821 RepID=UPI002DB7924C|nr:ABC transporter substrate-binding protein [Actinacidiphila sp. DG2A-62]MEC3994337.1 ABC transporter substrate-binding protein [Actinacidiphila sp. DG2A-62]
MRTPGRTRRTAVIAVAGLATCATLITACSSSDDDSKSNGSKSSSGEQITLHIGDFGSFGYDDKTGAKLFSEYEQLHPNIKIVEDNVSDGQQYWDSLKLHLQQNSGLDDIQAIEIGYIAEAVQPNLASKFEDFKTVKGFNADDWVSYKEKEATTSDGKVIGVGTDIGPTAICYRTDFFKQAGLPTDPAQVAALWNGDWSKFIQVGQQFKAKAPSGVAFTDSAGGLFNAVLSSQQTQYSDQNGKLVYDSSTGVQTAWNLSAQAIKEGLTAKLQQFDSNNTWSAAFKTGKFATVACPSWMIGQVASNSGPANKNKWDIAQPPQAGNWGGSFLAVPKSGKHVAEATALAQWLTAAAQEVKVFQKFGNIPSNKAGLADPAVQNATNDYFGPAGKPAPIGKIFSTTANAIQPAPIGPDDGTVKDIITKNGLLDMEQRGTSADKAWSNVKAQVKDKTGE